MLHNLEALFKAGGRPNYTGFTIFINVIFVFTQAGTIKEPKRQQLMLACPEYASRTYTSSGHVINITFPMHGRDDRAAFLIKYQGMFINL